MGTYKKIKKVTPTFNNVLIKFETQDEDIFENGVITTKYGVNGTPKPIIKVVAVGKNCQTVKAGDWVCVNWDRYWVPISKPSGMNIDGEHRDYRFTLLGKEVYIDDDVYYIISESDIQFIVADYDTVENKKPNITQVEKKKIIV